MRIGGAVLVAHHLADAVQMADAAVGAHDALLVGEFVARVERGVDAVAAPARGRRDG